MLTLFGAFNGTAGMISKEGLKPWEICGLCHSLDGISRMAKFPKLAGQKAGYIEKQLHDFKTGRRKNDGGQMEAIVDEITTEQIPEVAAYFAGLPYPTAVATSIDAKDIAHAKKIFEQGDDKRKIKACQDCHAKENAGYPIAPNVYAQHPDYLEKQLHDFKAKERANDKKAVMRDIAAALTDKEINILSQYIASQQR